MQIKTSQQFQLVPNFQIKNLSKKVTVLHFQDVLFALASFAVDASYGVDENLSSGSLVFEGVCYIDFYLITCIDASYGVDENLSFGSLVFDCVRYIDFYLITCNISQTRGQICGFDY